MSLNDCCYVPTTAALGIAKGTYIVWNHFRALHNTVHIALTTYTFTLLQGALQHFFRSVRTCCRSVAKAPLTVRVKCNCTAPIRIATISGHCLLSSQQCHYQLRSRWEQAQGTCTGLFHERCASRWPRQHVALPRPQSATTCHCYEPSTTSLLDWLIFQRKSAVLRNAVNQTQILLYMK